MLNIFIIYDWQSKRIPTNLGKKLLVKILSDRGCKISNEDIKRTSLGKPYIDNIPYKFSISYSDNVLVIAIADSDIGVDIEKMDCRKSNKLIVEKFFAENEKDYVRQKVNSRQSFFEIWTKKEAYVKYLGVGIDKNFKKYDVFMMDDEIRIVTFVKNNYFLSYCCKQCVDEKIMFHCIDISKNECMNGEEGNEQK